jgi:RNA polymerase sigma factor (sigma-70 family)
VRDVSFIPQLLLDQQSVRSLPGSAAAPSSRRRVRLDNGELERLRRVVESALRRVTSRRDPEYEDLVQSAMEGMLHALEADDLALERPPQWIAAVARNIAIDQLRARTRERRVLTLEDLEGSDANSSHANQPEHMTYVRQQIRKLEAALCALGPRRAIVVYLHDVLGYQLSEVAEAVGTSVAAAQSRLVRGRCALIRYMRRRPRGVRASPSSR